MKRGERIEGCQMPNLPDMADGDMEMEPLPFVKQFKRMLAKPWNYVVKKWLKRLTKFFNRITSQPNKSSVALENKPASPPVRLAAGDLVRVRSKEEIESTLDTFKELKGCAFLEQMWEYCGTTQKVFVSMERFLDERDYKVKKIKGVVLLEGLTCRGTPVFGRCDRRCLLFWREEWLEKIDQHQIESK